jgi:aquaporin Z
MVMVYAIGPISGCHINPAITVAMLVAKKISGKDAVAYIVMQCIGAVIGAGILFAVVSGMTPVNAIDGNTYDVGKSGLGQNWYGDLAPAGFPEFTLAAALIVEVVMTFFFLLVIFGATSKEASPGFAGLAIGFTLFLIHIVSIPVTGTSVNPARSLGPALFVGGDALSQLWLFWVAPFIGAILAALVWMYVFAKPEPKAQ